MASGNYLPVRLDSFAKYRTNFTPNSLRSVFGVKHILYLLVIVSYCVLYECKSRTFRPQPQKLGGLGYRIGCPSVCHRFLVRARAY